MLGTVGTYRRYGTNNRYRRYQVQVPEVPSSAHLQGSPNILQLGRVYNNQVDWWIVIDEKSRPPAGPKKDLANRVYARRRAGDRRRAARPDADAGRLPRGRRQAAAAAPRSSATAPVPEEFATSFL